MDLAAISARAFHKHQANFLIPVIIKHWETYRANLIERAKGVKNAVWCGDGRYDSMGHSAKYGIYSMLCCDLQKIVHFELLQVWCWSQLCGQICYTDGWGYHTNAFKTFSCLQCKKTCSLFCRPTRQVVVMQWNWPAQKDVFPTWKRLAWK